MTNPTPPSVNFRLPGAFGLVCLITTAILFVMNATGAIQISWWLVFAPLLAWIGLGVLAIALVILFYLIAIIVIAILEVRDNAKKRKRIANDRRGGVIR